MRVYLALLLVVVLVPIVECFCPPFPTAMAMRLSWHRTVFSPQLGLLAKSIKPEYMSSLLTSRYRGGGDRQASSDSTTQMNAAAKPSGAGDKPAPAGSGAKQGGKPPKGAQGQGGGANDKGTNGGKEGGGAGAERGGRRGGRGGGRGNSVPGRRGAGRPPPPWIREKNPVCKWYAAGYCKHADKCKRRCFNTDIVPVCACACACACARMHARNHVLGVLI
jgi:hypothetical protein